MIFHICRSYLCHLSESPLQVDALSGYLCITHRNPGHHVPASVWADLIHIWISLSLGRRWSHLWQVTSHWRTEVWTVRSPVALCASFYTNKTSCVCGTKTAAASESGGRLLLGPSTPRLTHGLVTRPGCGKVDPDSCVCVCVCVVSRLRLCYIRLLQWSTLFIPVPLSWPSSRWPVAAPGQGHGQGVGALEVSEVRDPPPCLLTAQSAFTFFPLVKQTRTDGVHSHFHGGVWVLSCFNCVRLCATPGTHQAPLSMGFPRQEYWSGLPFPSPGDLPDPGSKPVSPALGGRFFIVWATSMNKSHPHLEKPKTPAQLTPLSKTH